MKHMIAKLAADTMPEEEELSQAEVEQIEEEAWMYTTMFSSEVYVIDEKTGEPEELYNC